MIFLGTLVNTAAVLAGGSIGLLCKKGLPKRLSDTLMKGLGLCTLLIGVTGIIKGQAVLVTILSVVAGALIGEGVDLDRRINQLGSWISAKCKTGDGQTNLAQGFVAASLLFCVGAMTVIGSLDSGLLNNHTTLYTKSMLDFVAAILFASSFGFGVLFSAGFVLLYQGLLTLLAQWIAPYLTDVVIREMGCVGSLLIVGLALNMLGVTKLKVMNYLPAVFLPILFCLFL